MTTDDYTCIEDIEKVIHVVLPFAYAGNQTVGLKSTLDSWKFQYIKKLEGILIDYRNVKFLESAGRMLVEQPYAHYDVKATFSVFKPRCGRILKGVINKISKSHVGCVVHEFINVSISLSNSQVHEMKKFLMLDLEVLFEITKVDIQRRVPRVNGKFTEQCVELTEKLLPQVIENKHLYFGDDTNESSTEQSILDNEQSIFENDILAISTKKHKKHKKKHKSSNADDTSTSGFESLGLETDNQLPIIDSSFELPKGHKRKKKHKSSDKPSKKSKTTDDSEKDKKSSSKHKSDDESSEKLKTMDESEKGKKSSSKHKSDDKPSKKSKTTDKSKKDKKNSTKHNSDDKPSKKSKTTDKSKKDKKSSTKLKKKNLPVLNSKINVDL